MATKAIHERGIDLMHRRVLADLVDSQTLYPAGKEPQATDFDMLFGRLTKDGLFNFDAKFA